MDTKEIDLLLERQRAYFQTGATLPVRFRKEMLRKLYAAVERYEERINRALKADLGKSAF